MAARSRARPGVLGPEFVAQRPAAFETVGCLGTLRREAHLDEVPAKVAARGRADSGVLGLAP